jgi:hypothetical protein
MGFKKMRSARAAEDPESRASVGIALFVPNPAALAEFVAFAHAPSENRIPLFRDMR